MGPHDKAFRRLTKEKGVAEALLRERLSASLVARFAGPPEHLSESFIDDSLKDHVADIVLRVRLKGGAAACVYCLLEHKRTQEALLLVQVLRYITAIYAQFARSGGPPLPMVVPLIIYNGDERWTGPRRFSELIDASPQLRQLTVDFGVVLVDVGAESAGRPSSPRWSERWRTTSRR